jgi:diguanylate cyclase (GGDEF)-like protein/PAS domain S-box-containing protein
LPRQRRQPKSTDPGRSSLSRAAAVSSEALVSARNRVLEKIALGANLEELFAEIVDSVESLAPEFRAAAHLVDRDRGRLTRGVTRSLDRSVARRMERIPLDDSWPGGVALSEIGSTREPVSESYERLASEHDLGACHALPACSPRGEVVALLTVFGPRERRAKRSSRPPAAVLESAASLLALGVTRLAVLERLVLAQTSIDRSPEPAVCARENGSLLYWNRAFAGKLGYQDTELAAMSAHELVTSADERGFRRLFDLLARRKSLRVRLHAERKSGTPLPVSATIGLVIQGRARYLCALVRDASLEKEREERLRDCEERYALQARGAKDGLWDWNLEKGEVTLSSRYCELVGLGADERRASVDEWKSRVHGDDLARVEAELSAAMAGRSRVFESEHRMTHVEGRVLWVLVRGELFRAKDGRPTRIAGSLTDITGQKLAEERLRHDALHDELTGLPNRSMLMDRLRRLLERTKHSRREFRFAVLFLDFDRFKRVNDSLGHQAGDHLLAAIARRLSDCVRPGDTVARLGGDEFAIVLDRLGDVTEATRVAERVHQMLREPFHLHGIELSITTSIGIAVGDPSYAEPGDVLRDADTAMYRAKAAGKARHEIFDAAMHARAVEQLKLETEMRQALERDEFRVLYQPVVELVDRRIVGFEALTRWKHPTRGLLPPIAFLQTAEETGLIVELGWWVLKKACGDMKRWLASAGGERDGSERLSIHVNLSDRQLFHVDLADRVERTLADAGLAPGRLALDLSENVIMKKAESSVAILSQLKSLGVRIHLDDFGTGYSSLGYLHRFEIDALKIDRSFVRHLRAGGDNWTAVRTIVGLAHNLGMSVIAEGVETEEQLDELVGFGCAQGQGSLFYPPVRSEEIQDLLRRSLDLEEERHRTERAL